MFFSYLEVLILQILTFIFKILSQIEISFLFTMLHIVLKMAWFLNARLLLYIMLSTHVIYMPPMLYYVMPQVPYSVSLLTFKIPPGMLEGAWEGASRHFV